MFRSVMATTLLAVLSVPLLLAQTTEKPKPKPAPAKPAATTKPKATPKPAAAAKAASPKALTVDSIIGMAGAGLGDDLILAQVRKNNKAFELTPDDMIRLKQAKVSDNVIRVMIDPAAPDEPVAAAVAPTPTAAPTPTEPAAAPEPAVAAAPASSPLPTKRRVVVDEFDYSTVMTSVQAVFGTHQDIGKGIRAMLVKRLAEGGKVTVVERAKLEQLMKEQDLGASNRVKQGTNARIGRIKGADAIVMGDIVIFGRDDKKKGGAGGISIPRFGRFGGALGGLSNFNKDEKAVVAINFRMVDAETSEIVATGEARGESQRSSKDWGALLGAAGVTAGGVVDMTSQNFAETIIGEATMECVNKLAEQLDQQIPALPLKSREVEARVADVNGTTVILTAGSNDGVNAGDQFTIVRVLREVKDPVTKEVLDVVTEELGVVQITSVRDKIATGTYQGSKPLKVNDIARKQ